MFTEDNNNRVCLENDQLDVDIVSAKQHVSIGRHFIALMFILITKLRQHILLMFAT